MPGLNGETISAQEITIGGVTYVLKKGNHKARIVNELMKIVENDELKTTPEGIQAITSAVHSIIEVFNN